jgi:hypothetical protein
MDLELVAGGGKLGKDSYQIIINVSHMFVLCKESEVLRIFDLNTFDLVKEIVAKAGAIKLVSNSHFILIHFNECMVHLYSQSGNFEKLDQVELEIDDLYSVNDDKSSNIILFNCFRAKSLCFDTLFNIPMI